MKKKNLSITHCASQAKSLSIFLLSSQVEEKSQPKNFFSQNFSFVSNTKLKLTHNQKFPLE